MKDKREERRKVEEKLRNMRPISVGDKIIHDNRTYWVEKLVYADSYIEEKDGKYDIFHYVEFVDQYDEYRHWKSYFDGGNVVYKMAREEAIAKHREMWNWIADMYENGNGDYVVSLKRLWCKEHHAILKAKCYLCEYAASDCGNCPLAWGDNEDDDCIDLIDDYGVHEKCGLYAEVSNYSQYHQYKKAAEISRKIANLPEREGK